MTAELALDTDGNFLAVRVPQRIWQAIQQARSLR
jgi:hypothetical protein